MRIIKQYGISIISKELILFFGSRYLSIYIIHPSKRKFLPIGFYVPKKQQVQYELNNCLVYNNFFGFILYKDNQCQQ